MSKISIGIIYGGKSTEHEISMRSAESVLTVLDKKRYDINLIYITKSGEWLLTKAEDLFNWKEKSAEKVRIVSPGRIEGTDINKQLDVVIPILHGTMGEDGTVQGLLELAEVPYVGCNVRSSAICMDKDITKKLLKSEGIDVAKSVVFKYNEKNKANFNKTKEKLSLPMFVKPVNQGSSVGVSKVTDEKSFYNAIDEAFKYDTKVMVESAINGREIEVAILGNMDPFVSLPGEIISNTEFYSYESKYIDEKGASLEIPAKLNSFQVTALQEVALKTFKILDCEGLGRVDMFLTDDNEIFVNEVNTFPGFTNISMYPKLLEVSGIEYSSLIERLIELALQTHKLKTDLRKSLIK
ncbi:D-alanine--D-alanine ligase A [Jeotgalicoccus saudimassiliensis]|uniref:D-alanine--D-alanine ligase n=1 Tax=Jeotgalicoccus saudimassiliensis TaxID=1461582 RepID=A0A078M4U6_9STAP|nr:D-alanine--D-alanine ligase family protein [Jeotgalicoccus saudimassiliensis]CDZ99671.1 D-alanine--D-alanine ligase A [Jeotgalicoccus saudimassiliensis]